MSRHDRPPRIMTIHIIDERGRPHLWGERCYGHRAPIAGDLVRVVDHEDAGRHQLLEVRAVVFELAGFISIFCDRVSSLEDALARRSTHY